MKTNAARLLDSLNVAYEIREYEVDPEDLAAESVARKVGLPPEQVFHDVISVGAGMRGAQILLAPADYLRATGAKLG